MTDLTDRLLAALADRDDQMDEDEVREVDRRLRVALASGRLSQERLDAAFARAFPRPAATA